MEETWTQLPTWGRRSEFRYKGSVREGTLISWKDKSTATGWSKPWPVKSEEYRSMLAQFSAKVVEVGNYRNPTPGSLEDWLKKTYDQWGLTNYIPVILIEEGYAERYPSLPGRRAERLRFISS